MITNMKTVQTAFWACSRKVMCRERRLLMPLQERLHGLPWKIMSRKTHRLPFAWSWHLSGKTIPCCLENLSGRA